MSGFELSSESFGLLLLLLSDVFLDPSFLGGTALVPGA
jgi:hypothetical protein